MSNRIPIQVDPDLADLVPGYLEKRGQDIESMKAALSAGQYDVISGLGHKMKGTGSGYGFDKITEIGSALEIAGKAADKAKIESLIQELADYLSRIDLVPQAA